MAVECEQIDFPDATVTLMELFKDNRRLLDRISVDQVTYFVHLATEQQTTHL